MKVVRVVAGVVVVVSRVEKGAWGGASRRRWSVGVGEVGVVVGLICVAMRAAALEARALGGVAGPALDPDPQGDWWPPL